ncbi:(2Fe-2S)-binding protein [Arcobacter sp. CECT 8989]|uniref:(2Fe-2S)-binding protein n=1 Tax=Arcobacter sp. CECT 8989 TaxID=2044509 RepID=UPI00100B971B|nr:(2Fe-2S)-binding protein [Arcobacter sp. CECT 8989]RXJ99846.1 (2Fe-2S)-binding protein [Arcobacter sp. CECT 8989]
MLKDFDLDYEVCNCLKVSINDIKNSIENKNVKSLRDLQEVTKAGTECRHCVFPEGDFGKIKKKIYCKTVLNEVLNG